MKIFGLNIERSRVAQVQNKDVKRAVKSEIIRMIEKRALERDKATVSAWRDAVQMAESTYRPDRSELVRMIREVENDPHLRSVITARKNAVISTPFQIVNSNTDTQEPDDQATKKFDAEWFFDFIDLALDSRFYGYSLIELKDIVDDQFSGVELVPREYVVPEKMGFKKSTSSFDTIPFGEPPFDMWSIFVGSKSDLGLITHLIPHLIFKKDVFSAWSEYADLFGMPMRIGYTDVMNDKKRSNMESMLSDMGSFSWASLDKDDKIELKESNNRDAFNVFKEMIMTVDQQVSKMILGQTGTTDEKSFVGSAEVHERVAIMYAQTDRRFIENVINNKLLPLMKRHGIIAENMKFEFVNQENLSIMQQKEIIADLSPHYQFDVEQLSELFGFNLEQKENQSPQFMNSSQYLDEVSNLYSEALKSGKK